MKNPNGRRGGRLWFWSGVILLSISASIWLLAIPGAASGELDWGDLIVGGVIITILPIGLGIYCVRRGRKSRVAVVPPVPVPPVSQRGEGVLTKEERARPSGLGSGLWSGLGVILIAIGVWMAIGTLPISLVASIVFFAPIGGLGLLIGYKLKRIRSALLWGLGVAAWGYLLYAILTDWDLQFHTATNYYTKTTMTLFFYSLMTVVPIAVLGTLAIAWLARKKLSPDSKTLSAFFKLLPFTLLIATPFIIGGLSDYNYRSDTNPQVMNLRIVDKWIDRWATEEWNDVFIVKGETLDGNAWFSFPVSADFYNEHDIGSDCWISVHNGALGYPYISQEHGD